MFGVFLIGKQPHQKLDGAFTVKQVSRKLDEIAENCSAREGAAINTQTDRMRDLLIGGN